MAAGVSAFLLTVPVWGHSTCCLVKRCHFVHNVRGTQPPPPLLLWSCPTGNQEINGTEVAQWIWMWCGMKLVSAASVLLIAPWSGQSWNFTASTKQESRWDYEVSCIYAGVSNIQQLPRKICHALLTSRGWDKIGLVSTGFVPSFKVFDPKSFQTFTHPWKCGVLM